MIKIYNSLTRQVDVIKPINDKKIGIYVCGPTVYAPSHVGHARTWIFFDWLRRFLIFKGYEVKFVQNITDVGHLVGDSEEGEDKIEKIAKDKNISPKEIAHKYEKEYFKDLEDLNILKPDYSPKATEHINDIIEFVKVLIEKGNAYEKEGNVYFSVKTFSDYGKLSGRKIDEEQAGGRVEKDELKNDPADFALWLKADSSHLQKWPSPWGDSSRPGGTDGYPGWHIECSVMASKILGQPFEVHGSASEHIFPHHENEIAQSESFAGKPLANIFVHSGMLLIGGQKMSKSLGNYLTISDVLKENDADMVKLAFMGTFWRKPFNWDKNAIFDAKKLKDKLVRAKIAAKEGKGEIENIIAILEDDFNVPKALTYILENLAKMTKSDFEALESIFGLKLEIDVELSQKQQELVNNREKARKEGDFELADKLRKELEGSGIVVEDTSEGPRVIKT